jgi:hypothetical protein
MATVTDKKTAFASVVAHMEKEAKQYVRCNDRLWYVWVSRSGYVSIQDGEPTDRDAYFCMPVSQVLYGFEEDCETELRDFLGLDCLTLTDKLIALLEVEKSTSAEAVHAFVSTMAGIIDREKGKDEMQRFLRIVKENQWC